jgi:hypothetical protein
MVWDFLASRISGLQGAEAMKKQLSTPPLPGTSGREEMQRPSMEWKKTSLLLLIGALLMLDYGLIDVLPPLPPLL